MKLALTRPPPGSVAGAAACVVLAVCPSTAALGQPVADRVPLVRDGTVRMAFAARRGVCAYGSEGTFEVRRGAADWEPVCDGQLVRVRVALRDGVVVAVVTYVGGRWRPRPETRDLGIVPVREAVDFFLDLAARADGQVSEHAILPAALADSVTVSPRLARIARTATRPRRTRKAAIFWLGQTGEDDAVEALRELFADIADRALKESIIFSISQDPRGAEWLAALALDARERLEFRERALFWLGQSRHPIDGLVGLYGRLESDDLREQLIFVLSQRDEGAALDMLMRIARTGENRRLRDRAIFWLGQSGDPRAVDFLAQLIVP